MSIPKTIHVIWIGDETKRPEAAIQTWRIMNPGYDLRVWGNADVQAHDWYLGDLIEAWAAREINGAADILRWEILLRYGGLAFDADSACVRPLEDWLLDTDAFAVWENEIRRPSLIATGAMGFVPNHFLVASILKDIRADPKPFGAMAWQKLGPGRLTDTVRALGYIDLTVYPSHYFLPRHFTGLQYSGSGPVFAQQFWGSTFRSYGDAMTADIDATLHDKPTRGADVTQVVQAVPVVQAAPVERVVQAIPDQNVCDPVQRRYKGEYFFQKLTVRDVAERLPYLKTMVAGRRVLHVGCTDFPVFDPRWNLHIQLKDDCSLLDGLDTDREGMDVLSKHVDGKYFSKASDVVDQYDLVLVPETIEHVHNIQTFLAELDTINFREIIITAPCLIGWNHNFNYIDRPGRLSSLLAGPQDYIEEVHPDHKAWFTPYTLANCVEQFTSWQINEVLFLDNKRMTAVHCVKNADAVRAIAA